MTDVSVNVSVIIPTWNEKENIAKTIDAISKALGENKMAYEIIVADDNSTDGTKDIVTKIKNPSVKLLNRNPPYGFGYSIREAVQNSHGEMIAVMMADLSDDPTFLVKMKEKIDQGYDVVVGSRFLKGSKVYDYPFLKMVSNRLFNNIVRLFFWTEIKDTSNAFKAFRANRVKEIKIESRGFEVSAEMMLRLKIEKAKICEIPVTWTDREKGQAKFKLYNTFINYFILFLKMVKLAYLY